MSNNLRRRPAAVKQLIVVEASNENDDPLAQETVTAKIGRNICFDAAVLDTFDVRGCEPFHYDILVLCAAVEIADRRWKRPRGWHRSFNVTVPVIDLEAWLKPKVAQSLSSLLNHLTGDTWRFDFVQAINRSPIGWRQTPLDFGATKTFAVAYSEGLDSRAVSALSGGKTEALCIRVAGTRQRPKDGDSYFTQIPFKIEGYRGNESSFRSRGFKFAAMTAIAAQIAGVSRIVVPESGQGALGPVLLPLHNIYADYRNHPTFFRKMEQFIAELCSYKLRFEQPRLWFTKGQTLRAFIDAAHGSERDLINTHSCWQTRRIVNVGRRRQCGLCAACLLRRLSLHAAGVTEPADTYIIADLTASSANDALSAVPQKADRDIMIEYGSVGARHLQHLANMSRWPDVRLRIHASQIAAGTGKAYRDTLLNLRMMLTTHAEEWQAFLTAQGGKSFLTGWMDGGRYGDSE